jgi:hypothetical protein
MPAHKIRSFQQCNLTFLFWLVTAFQGMLFVSQFSQSGSLSSQYLNSTTVANNYRTVTLKIQGVPLASFNSQLHMDLLNLHKFDGRNATIALHFTGADLLFQFNRFKVLLFCFFEFLY